MISLISHSHDLILQADTSKTFTYTAGTLVGGLVEMFKLDKNQTHLHFAHNVSLSVMKMMTKHGVLMESCDHDYSCNLDANIFKGIFVRNLRYLMDVTSNKTQVQVYRKFLTTNIASLTKHSMCDPDPAKNHTCHIVYLDGAPSYAPTGKD